MKKRNYLLKRWISLLMIATMLVSMLTGCGSQKEVVENDIPDEVIEQIVESTTNEILEDLHLEQVNGSSGAGTLENLQQPHLSTEEVVEASEAFLFSDNWEDYVGDMETFVYGLIANELSYRYDVFPGYVELSDGTCIYGIAYSDYTECYTNEDESVCYFTAGLLPLWGEFEIPQEEFDRGLILHNMDFESENTSFILTYASSEYTEHCVVYGQYLKYGVDEAGHIAYETEAYVKGNCDETLGTLYSYDEARDVWVSPDDLGNYLLLSGTTLSSQIDYALLEQEINAVLEQQDFNFASVDVESYAYFAQEAVTSYLLSLQEETFLGYRVEELVRLAETLDPLQCLRVTDDGIMAIDLKPAPKEGADAVVQWLVGTSCVIVTVVGMVASTVCVACPPLSMGIGAITGVAIEVFMQVVIENENLEDVSWNRVVLAAATGAVSGLLGPYVAANAGSAVSAFWIDSALDGLLGGIELAANAWLEGESGIETIKSFGYGMALGSVLSAGFKGVCKMAAKVADAIAPKVAKLSDSVFPNLVNKVSKAVDDAEEGLNNLVKQADPTVSYSRYVAEEMVEKQVRGLSPEVRSEILEKSINSFRGNFTSKTNTVTDLDGNLLTEEKLCALYQLARNGDVLGQVQYKNGMIEETVDIIKKHGMITVNFDTDKYYTVTLEGGLVPDRGANFEKMRKLLLQEWQEDASRMPTDIAEVIKKKGLELINMSTGDLQKIIKECDYAMHETPDGYSMMLIPHEVHDAIKHMGGFALSQYVKFDVGTGTFEQLSNVAASGTPAFAQ